MFRFDTKNVSFNDYLNMQFKFFVSTIKPCFLNQAYTSFKSADEIINYIKPKDCIIPFFHIVEDLKMKLSMNTYAIVDNLNDQDYLLLLSDVIEKLYNDKVYTPTLRDIYALDVILDVATRYIHFSSSERLDIVIGLTRDFVQEDVEDFLMYLDEMLEKTDCKNFQEFAGSVLTTGALMPFIYADVESLDKIIELNYFKDEEKDVNALINQGKSFKQINQIYIEDSSER